MKELLRFFAAGDPKGQPRPRAFSRGGHARVFDPGTAEGWKSSVALAAKPHLDGKLTPFIFRAVCLHLEFFFRRPKAHCHSGKKAHILRDDAPGYHTGKPDADNCAKAVMDALTVLRLWGDDAMVAHLIVRKLYADDRGPGCLITVCDLEMPNR